MKNETQKLENILPLFPEEDTSKELVNADVPKDRQKKETGKIHAGHRGRIRNRFNGFGFEVMEPHVVLELLLCFSIRRKDVNPLAHRLINEFHGLVNVMNADYERLIEVPGVGERTATLIRLVSDISRYVGILQSEAKSFENTKQIAEFLLPYFSNLDHEVLYMLCLNASNHLLSLRKVSSGTSKQMHVDIRDIAREAVRTNADKVILAHNHPNGALQPSSSDRATTSMVRQALAAVNVTLTDHIIVAGSKSCSIKDIYPMLDF